MARPLLLDVHINLRVTIQLRTRGFDVVGLSEWYEGYLRQAVDLTILQKAHREQRTLVTFDLGSISDLLLELSQDGEAHSGVIFVSSKTIRQDDVGGIVLALDRTLRERLPEDATNFTTFLAP